MTAYRLDRILEWTQEFTHGKRKEMRRSVIYPLMLQLLRKMEWRTDMGADLLHDPSRALTHIFIEKNLDLAARKVVEPALQVLKIEPVIQKTRHWGRRSEEHTSELQSLMRTPYAFFCLQK